MTRIGARNCVYRILVRNLQRKKPLRRARREWYNIKYIKGECKNVDLIILLRIRSSSGLLWTPFGFLKRRGMSWPAERSEAFHNVRCLGIYSSYVSKLPLLQGWALPQPSAFLLTALRTNKDLCGVNPLIGHSKVWLRWSIFRQFSACWVYS